MRTLLIVLGMLLFGADASANRARVLVAGQGDGGIGLLRSSGDTGSLYVRDPYNMFYNPVYVHDAESSFILEKFNGNERPMGVLIGSVGPVKWGLGLNREDEVSAYLNDQDANVGTSKRAMLRPVDLVIGMNTGFQWGVGVTFAGYSVRQSSGVEDSASHVVLRIGARVLGAEPFAFATASGTETQSQVTYRRERWGAGLKYPIGPWTPYIMWQATANDTSATRAPTVQAWGLGIGRHLAFERWGVDLYSGFFRTGRRNVFPFGASLVATLSKWVALRGGLLFRMFDRQYDVSQSNNTAGRMGVTLTAGRFDFDWAIGGQLGGFFISTGDDVVDGDTFGPLDGRFFTAASLTYRI